MKNRATRDVEKLAEMECYCRSLRSTLKIASRSRAATKKWMVLQRGTQLWLEQRIQRVQIPSHRLAGQDPESLQPESRGYHRCLCKLKLSDRPIGIHRYRPYKVNTLCVSHPHHPQPVIRGISKPLQKSLTLIKWSTR